MNEGRRMAAARVKARIKQDQKLPGFHRNRKLTKQSSKIKNHSNPWNDRFTINEDVNQITKFATMKSNQNKCVSYFPFSHVNTNSFLFNFD